MDQRNEEAVITARVTYNRGADRVTVVSPDGTRSTYSGEAQRLHTAIAGLEQAQRVAVRALVVAECAMNNVAGQYGIRWNVRSITQP